MKRLADPVEAEARRGRPPPVEGDAVAWLHAGDALGRGALSVLRQRLSEEDPSIALAVTGRAGTAPPDDYPGFVRAFLDAWRPAAMVWAEPGFRPILQGEALERGLRPIIVGGPREHDVERTGRRVGRFLCAPTRIALVAGYAEAETLRRLGVPATHVEVTGDLQSVPSVPAVDEERLGALAAALAGRPVWLAAGTPSALVPSLSAAQGELRRRMHKALMILETDTPPAPKSGIVRADADTGLPDRETAILVVPPGTRGLWARLASVTVLSDTLAGDPGDPSVPAALGSAVIHAGPPSPLDALGGAVRIASAAQVAAAVEDLLAPDRAAILARVGWDLATEGAEATDRLVAEIIAAVDDAPVERAE